MRLIERIIKSLGGFTQEEFLDFSVKEQQRRFDFEHTSTHNFEEGTAYLKAVIDRKDLEIQRLTDLMLKEHGIIRDSAQPKQEGQFQPIRRRESMQEKLKKLEKEDSNLNAKILEDRWKEYQETVNARVKKEVENLEKEIGLD